MYMYVREANKAIDTAMQERSGMPLISVLMQTVKTTHYNRGVIGASIKGFLPGPDQRDSARTAVDKSFSELLKVAAEPAVTAVYRTEIEKIAADWKSLREANMAKSLNVMQSRERHDNLIGRLHALRERAVDDYGLSLDPEAATFHLIMGGLLALPNLAETLYDLRAKTTDVLAEQASDEDDRTSASVYVEKVANYEKAANDSIVKAIAADKALEAILEPLRAEAGKLQKDAMDVSRTVLIGNDLSIKGADYRARIGAAVDAQEKLAFAAFNELDRLLLEREVSLKSTLHKLMAFIAVAVVLALALGILIVRSIVKPLGIAVGVADAIAGGKLDNAIVADTNDETGRLAKVTQGHAGESAVANHRRAEGGLGEPAYQERAGQRWQRHHDCRYRRAI